ncbi:hypothetical protein D3C72_478160 [compost metagenome]
MSDRLNDSKSRISGRRCTIGRIIQSLFRLKGPSGEYCTGGDKNLEYAERHLSYSIALPRIQHGQRNSRHHAASVHGRKDHWAVLLAHSRFKAKLVQDVQP